MAKEQFNNVSKTAATTSDYIMLDRDAFNEIIVDLDRVGVLTEESWERIADTDASMRTFLGIAGELVEKIKASLTSAETELDRQA